MKRKSRAVKRISSTGKARRPKQLVVQNVPEIKELPNIEQLATAPVAGGTPVDGRVVLGASCTIHEARQLREQLLAAQMRVELGELSQQDFETFEADILARLREIRERKQGSGAVTVDPNEYTISGIEATFEGGHQREE